MERHRPLLDQARKRFQQLKLHNVVSKHGDGHKGWPEQAPFDRIIVTAAVPEVPEALIEQLKPGGILIAPLAKTGAAESISQHLTKIIRVEDGVREQELIPAVFVPMVPGMPQEARNARCKGATQIGFRVARFAALVLLVAPCRSSGCATAPAGHTQLSWPVGTTYTVRSGDTVSEIAEDYGLSETALVRYNGLGNPDRIYVGQVLRIPRDSYRVAATRPAPRPCYAPRRAAHHAPRPRSAMRAEPRRAASPRRSGLKRRRPIPVRCTSSGLLPAMSSRPSARPRMAAAMTASISPRPLGEPIRAAAAGNVIYAGNELKGYGNLVLIRHEDGYVTAYAHAERIAVDARRPM